MREVDSAPWGRLTSLDSSVERGELSVIILSLRGGKAEQTLDSSDRRGAPFNT